MIIITGQTATGKTKLALKYAKEFNGELVNFDSRQVYKYLDIITGKDIPAAKIWLYDIVKPNEYFSSFEYIKYAQNVIEDIKKRGKMPILVGGSYFYLKHLLYGFDFKAPPNFKLREKLNKKTVSELQKILNKIDLKIKKTMNNSDWNNPRRLIRKIEIEEYRKKNKIKNVKEKKESYKILKFIGLRYKEKKDLYMAISKRVKERIKQGAVEEVEKILKKGYKKTDYGLKTIGYKQLIEFIEKKVKKEKAIENWITAEMQYAKRQYTFMKKDKNIEWRRV